MKKLILLLLLLIGGHASSQETGDIVFCWNVSRQTLEVQNVDYVSNENLLDPNDTGDRFPVITAIESSATSTTVSGTIVFSIHANDDNGIARYSFFADTPYDGDEYQVISKSGTSSTTTLQFPSAGRWRTYFDARDTSGQNISAVGPIIIVN